MRCKTVEEIMGKLGKTKSPAELHVEPDGEPPVCTLVHPGTNQTRLALVAENALHDAFDRGAPGVMVIGHLPG